MTALLEFLTWQAGGFALFVNCFLNRDEMFNKLEYIYAACTECPH